MAKTFGKQLLFQLFAAAATVLTLPIFFALLAMKNTSFFEAYLFYLVLSSPVIFFLGSPISAAIRTANRSYLVNLIAYALAGAAAMYAYLATVLSGFQLHTSGGVGSFLAIGAGSALYMYHVSLALESRRKRIS